MELHEGDEGGYWSPHKFHQHYLALYLDTSSMRVLWNGEVLDSFKPSRGIKQSEPLFPCLFVLCMERLSHLIGLVVDSKLWESIQLGHRGPKLSHLAFAYDLLFSEASMEEQVEIISFYLELFCNSSA